MRKKVGSLEDIIYFGIERIESDEKVVLDLQDFLVIYRAMEELRRFFHNEEHYPNLEVVNEFIGTNKFGMLKIINAIYRDILNKSLNKSIEDILESDALDSELIPFYYLKNN